MRGRRMPTKRQMSDTELKVIEDIREYQELQNFIWGEPFDYRKADDWLESVKHMSMTTLSFAVAEQMRREEEQEKHDELKGELMDNMTKIFSGKFMTLEQRRLMIDSLAIIRML